LERKHCYVLIYTLQIYLCVAFGITCSSVFSALVLASLASESNCSALAKEFSVSDLRDCIFFLMASMVREKT
jgi:hypothetical protein